MQIYRRWLRCGKPVGYVAGAEVADKPDTDYTTDDILNIVVEIFSRNL